MFVISLKLSRTKLIGLFCVCFALAVLILAGVTHKNSTQPVISTSILGSTNVNRLTFITSKGWEVADNNPVTVAIIIPSEFDNIYQTYNVIQKKQNFDLTKYKGKKVTRYTYIIKNYPTAQESPVNINLLIYDDVIIGGDVCSTALGGFIHGFTKPS